MSSEHSLDALVAKLKAVEPKVRAAQKLVAQQVQDRVSAQRELEGLRAAVRDPKTGKVYSGWTHQTAIESCPQNPVGDDEGVWGRLHAEWDRATEHVGFLDRQGAFVSRSEAEAKWNVLTVEDVRDALKAARGSSGYPRPR